MHAAFVSIRPEHMARLVSGEKTHEFRDYRLKEPLGRFYIYVSGGEQALAYMAYVQEPVERPGRVDGVGAGNEAFNQGLLGQYAFPVESLFAFDEPILLDELRRRYGFSPPQRLTYAWRYPSLARDLETAEKRRIPQGVYKRPSVSAVAAPSHL